MTGPGISKPGATEEYLSQVFDPQDLLEHDQEEQRSPSGKRETPPPLGCLISVTSDIDDEASLPAVAYSTHRYVMEGGRLHYDP